MGDGELNKMELWRASALWILGRWGCDLPSHFNISALPVLVDDSVDGSKRRL